MNQKNLKKALKRKKKRKYLFRDALFCTLLSLLSFAAFASIIFSISYFNPIVHSLKDFSFLDAYYQANLPKIGQVDERIVLVNIGDLNRSEITDLIKEIDSAEPGLIGVDVIFAKDDNYEVNRRLKSVLAEAKAINAFILSDTISSNLSTITATQGYVNLTISEATGILRSFEGIRNSDKNVEYAFAAQLIRQFDKGRHWNKQHLEKKLKKIKRIKFYGHYNAFPYMEGKEIIHGENTNKLRNKLVIVGYLGQPTGNVNDVEDKHFTPLNQNPLGKGIPDMYGITVHANIANMLLTNDFFFELSLLGRAILLFVCCYLACLYFIWLDRKLKISYRTVRKLVLFVFALCFVGFCLWLLGKSIAIEPTWLVIITIYTAGFVKYYKHLVRYIKAKYGFKSYIK